MEATMPGSSKISFYALAGALGGSAVWVFILILSNALSSGLLTELLLGALSGMFIGGFIWSHEAITGRQFHAAIRRAGYGAAAGILGGAAGAILGSTVFTGLGRLVVDQGGFSASLGISLSVALGWAILGAAVGASGGMMIRSRERIVYGLAGGSLGGFLGGILFNALSATNIWSALAGLFSLGACIGGFISIVEEAFVSAKVKVIKGRHINREFPILKEMNSIGRDDRSDVCLSGAEGVGMQHAFITRKKGSFSIEQGQGGTGVYVNHQKTEKCRLSDGDVIRIGSILLMFNAVKKAAAAVVLFLVLGSLFVGPAPLSAEEVRDMRITQFDLSGFPLVKAYVSILDRNGKAVRGLDRHDISIMENGRPVAIKEMRMGGTSGKREPLSLSLVLDKSGSMTGDKIARAKESVLRFISLMEPGDRASLFAFSDDVAEIESLTGNGEKLKKAALSLQPGGHTALYDAIVRGADSVKGSSGRRAVIVLSDGIANRGVMNIDQSIDSAVKGYVSVYVIGLGEDVRTARLERIAQETGGTYFFTPSPEGLAAIYETISRRIKNEYVITYETGQRGEYLRKASLELKKGTRAERAYFQPKSSLFGTGGKVPGWALVIPLMSIAGLVGISLRNIEHSYRTGHLSVVQGRASRKEIDINSIISLGRDERNAVGLFQDNRIDQYHAEVQKENGRYFIKDKGTSSGTFVNRKKISGACTLTDGDVIDIGSARIVFSQGSGHTCPACGSAMRSKAKFCPKCGAKTT
jgi:VWFA-related protein